MRAAEPGPAVSFVVPVHDEEHNVVPLHAELTAVAHHTGRTYELVFVDDGSRDATLARLLALAAADPRLRVVELDGNFGEAAALSAGFATAAGDVVVTLDGDGQNDPADVPRLLETLDQGYDAVSGRRARRQERFGSRVLPSLVANRLIVLATGVPAYDCGCGLKAYRRKLVQGARLPRGFNRFLPAILGVDPRRVAEIPTRDRPRGGGQSHYGLSRVAVVLRDLPAIPLLTRLGLPPRALARGLGALLALVAAGAALAAGTGHPGTAAPFAVAALVVWSARHGADRMARAREAGVFRVRKVHDGRTTARDRDRGRRVLGQEAAPHVR
jgi:glycosyltransferase involved in cell wall biosynthesis